MKKIILYMLILLATGMAACFDDDTTLGTDFIPDIEISGLRDTSIVSFSGNLLEITPEITTEYDESELSYAWYLDYGQKSPDEPAKQEKIGVEKTLSYEVNLSTGEYNIFLVVTAEEYDYSRRAKMKLSATTAFSKGYYVLKETADGRSELDLANGSDLNEDLMTARFGAPLEGAPFNLTVTYGQCYIDEETQEMAYTKGISVFTDKSVHIFSADDLRLVQDPSTMFYAGEPQEGERFYSVAQNGSSMYLFTNKGLYYASAGGEFIPGYENVYTGKYGVPQGTCASKHAQMLRANFNFAVAYWNEAERLLYWGNTVDSQPLNYELPEGMDAATVECLARGTNYVGGVETVWFLLRDAANNRCLVLPKDSKSECGIVEIDPALRFAKAEIMAGNTRSATAIYFISDNHLWAYRLDGTSEYEIPLPGVEGTITYVSNPFISVAEVNLNSLVVVTETGENYNLYIFGKDNLVGGAPQRAVEPLTGTGKVKSVRYLSGEKFNLGDMTYGDCIAIPWTD